MTELKQSTPTERGTARRWIVGGIAVAACAIACSIPLLAGGGAIALGAGALGGERAFFAAALGVLVVAYVVWWMRRRKAAAARSTVNADPLPLTAQDHASCDVGGKHSCSGKGGCGC